MITLIISLVIFLSYVAVVYKKYKPSCISESYYLIKYKDVFTYWIVLVSFLIFPAWVEISPINFQFLPFLSVTALCIVGLNPQYLESQRKVHIVAAVIAVTLSLIWNLVIGQFIIPTILGIILLTLYKVKNLLFWTECAAFLNIYLSILLS